MHHKASSSIGFSSLPGLIGNMSCLITIHSIMKVILPDVRQWRNREIYSSKADTTCAVLQMRTKASPSDCNYILLPNLFPMHFLSASVLHSYKTITFLHPRMSFSSSPASLVISFATDWCDMLWMIYGVIGINRWVRFIELSLKVRSLVGWNGKKLVRSVSGTSPKVYYFLIA